MADEPAVPASRVSDAHNAMEGQLDPSCFPISESGVSMRDGALAGTARSHLHTKYLKIDLGKVHLKSLAHSGDKLDAAAGRDAPRFHHECTSSTFMTPTHVAYMVHACSSAVARATAKAARLYAHTRATHHSVRENTLTRPAVIQPTF